MFYPLLAAVLANGTAAATQTGSFQERLAQSPSAVLAPDGTPLPSSVVLIRRWEGDVCFATLENRSTQAVNVGSIVLAEFAHGLAPDAPLYGEGFTMLSQTGGTIAQPVDEGFYTDRQHYRIPEPQSRRTVYGVLTLRPAPDHVVLLGFTGASRFVGRFAFDATTLSVSYDGEGLALPAGGRWDLEPLLVAGGPDRNALLERLASELNRNHPPIFRPPVATGWCSWYCFGPGVTATQIRGNLAWAKQHFPGLRYIQIDDGYQPWMGDWIETGKSFGGDVRSVLRDIRAEGFEPAIWVAPFVASPESQLFREHADWFVKDAEGQPLRSDRVGFGGWRLGPWYVLDGTHPEAQRWLEDLFRTMRQEWGCTYFKLDANYWGTLHGGVHHDRNATRVEAYRRGMEAIRRGAGEAFILGCNHPLWPSLGLIHGSRSSMDVSRDWYHFAKTGRENLLRGWQNGRLWWNDPDALCLNGKVLAEVPDAAGAVRDIGKASEDEFLFHATLVYATGGMLLAGDDLRTYGDREKKRLEVLYPPTGQAMRFASERFDVGRLELPDAEMVAVLNWEDAPRDFTVPISGRARVTERWSGQELGVHEGTLTLPAVPAHSGRLLRMVRLDGRETTAAPPEATDPQSELRAFLLQFEKRYVPLVLEGNEAWWEASVTGSDEAFARRQRADNAINELLSDRQAFARIKGWLQRDQIQDPLLRRQLEVLYREHLPRQVEKTLLERMVKLSAEVEQVFNTHRSVVGGRELTENEVRNIQSTSHDSAQVKAAWEAYMAVGAKVEAKLKELVRLRNDSARALGFATYYDLALAGQEFTAPQLTAIFDELDRLTAAPFAAAKAEVDAALSRKFGCALGDLRHWHYQDLFFQEAPPIYGVDLDALYAKVELERVVADYYRGLGLDATDILRRSDLYERPGKSPHAFCVNLDRADDVRILTNLKNDVYWADTLLHELGHGVYDKYLDRDLPFLLREPAHILTTEGIAMLFGRLAKSPAWLADTLGLPADQARAVGDGARKTARLEALVFSRWVQVMVRFEQGLYQDPDQDLPALWNGLKQKYQGITPAEGRGAPDYAAKIHVVTTPVYYHNYQLGALFASQAHRYMAGHVLGGADPRTTSYSGKPEVGAYLRQKIFAPAARLPWNEMVRQATGEELSPKAFAAEFLGE